GGRRESGPRGARGPRLDGQAGRWRAVHGHAGPGRPGRGLRAAARGPPGAGPMSLSEPGPSRWGDGSREVQPDFGVREDASVGRIVDPGGGDEERRIEAALRPRRLADLPGQQRVRDQLGLVLEAARRRAAPPDHVLLSGPPGLGKTSLAMIIAGELEQPLRITSGPAIQHAGDLAAVLSSLAE